MSNVDGRSKVPFVAPIRARNLIWIAVLAAGWLAAQHYGTPHLRVQYTWSGRYEHPLYHVCDYWGLSSFRVRPANGQCPLIVFAKAARN